MTDDIELDPDKRDWVYDDNGVIIYKNTINSIKQLKTNFKKYGMYHIKMDYGGIDE